MPKEITQLLTPAARYYAKPFRYDSDRSAVVDSKENMVVDVRGWGYLTGRGHAALALTTEQATEVQDGIGDALVIFLNSEWPNT